MTLPIGSHTYDGCRRHLAHRNGQEAEGSGGRRMHESVPPLINRGRQARAEAGKTPQEITSGFHLATVPAVRVWGQGYLWWVACGGLPPANGNIAGYRRQ